MLMASPRAKGLFQRAIGESGGLFEPLQLAPRYLLANAEHDGEKYVASLGATSIQELRRMPAGELLKGSAGDVSHPVIEPYVLPASPYEAFAAGRQNDVPLLHRFQRRGSACVDECQPREGGDVRRRHRALLRTAAGTLIAAYPHATDEEARQARLDLERDLRFGWDMWAWARLQAGTGKNPVYYYYFRQQPPFPAGSVYEGWGASHFAELWYVFDHLDQEPWKWTASDRKLAQEMPSYWVNFAKTGDPNGTGLAVWPAFTNAGNKVLYLGDPITVGGVANLKSMTVLDGVYDSLRGKVFAGR